jgi:hypothetical protein
MTRCGFSSALGTLPDFLLRGRLQQVSTGVVDGRTGCGVGWTCI